MNINGMNLALREITGSKNVLISDDMGIPSVMVKIPRFNISDVISDGPDTPHPMFIVDGEVKDAIYVGKFLATVNGQRAYSLPGRDPASSLTLEDAITYASNKGEGWHVMTNAERAGVGLLCKTNQYFPSGNNNDGKCMGKPYFRGVPSINNNAGTFAVGDVAKISNQNTDDFIEFNKSNARSMVIDSYEGATLDGTTSLGSKISATIDGSTADKIEKVEFYVNKRSDSLCDQIKPVPNINDAVNYNSGGSCQQSVIKDGSVYKMWFTGQDANGIVRILYAESTDNIKWIGPVLCLDVTASQYCAANMYTPCVIKDGDTYKMWFRGDDTAGVSRILYCTSSDGINWSTPVLSLDMSSQSLNLAAPMVCKIGDNYHLWVTAKTKNLVATMYHYTSSDGINWSNGVITIDLGSTVNSDGVRHQHVLYENNTFKIWYCATLNGVYSLRYSTSTDGIHWGAPTITTSIGSYITLTDSNKISVINDGGVYRYWISGGSPYKIYSGIMMDGHTVPTSTICIKKGSDANGYTDGIGVFGHCVIKDGTMYKMWFSTRSTDGKYRILYSTSTDGNTWVAPVMVMDYANAIDSSSNGVLNPIVIKDGDVYKMWYNVYVANDHRIMAYSTSSDGMTWSQAVQVINYNQMSGGWDSYDIQRHSIIKDGTMYKAWISASNGANVRIAYSSSPDGITWTVPVLSIDINTNQYNAVTAISPCVVKINSVYNIWYRSGGLITHATSTDGINWSNTHIALLPKSNADNNVIIADNCVLYDGTTYRMWFVEYFTNNNGPCQIYTISSVDPDKFGSVLTVDNSTTPVAANYCGASHIIYDEDEKKYKMWLSCWPRGNAYDGAKNYITIGYTESLDMKKWNNIVTVIDTYIMNNAYVAVASPKVIKGTDGVYRMVFSVYNTSKWLLASATSNDGKNWGNYTLIPSVDSSKYYADIVSSILLSMDGTYLLYIREVDGTANTNNYFLRTTKDFVNWSDPKRVYVKGDGVHNNNYNSLIVYYESGIYYAISSIDGISYMQYSLDGINFANDILSRSKVFVSGFVGVNNMNLCSMIKHGGTYYFFISYGDDASTYSKIGYGVSPFLSHGNRIKATMSDGTQYIRGFDMCRFLRCPMDADKKCSTQLGKSSTILDNGVYKKWFNAADASNVFRIFYTTSNDAINWSTPVVAMEAGSNTYNTKEMDEFCVIKDGTGYRAAMCVRSASDAAYRIITQSSTDGINWTFNSVLAGLNSPIYATAYAGHPAMIKDGDTYKVWFRTLDKGIMLITSKDFATWSTPVSTTIAEGGSGVIEVQCHPSTVIKESDTSYKMYGEGQRADSTLDIFYTTSSDGLNWATPTIIIPNGIVGMSPGLLVCNSTIKVSDTKYQLFLYSGPVQTTDANTGGMREFVTESADGVTKWSPDSTNPIQFSNIAVVGSANSGEGYVNVNVATTLTPYPINQEFNYAPGTSINRLPMRNAKRIRFYLQSASSADGKTPARLMFGDFYTNGDIQDIYISVDGRSSDSVVSIYSKNGTNLIAQLTPTTSYISGRDLTVNADGIVVKNYGVTTNPNIEDSYAKIQVIELYGHSSVVRTLTGTCGTGHDGTASGIMDLTGNVWEMNTGCKLSNGKILVTENNDSALLGFCDDDAWNGIDVSGNLVDPDDPNALCFDGVDGQAYPAINNKVTKSISGAQSPLFNTMTSASGIYVPSMLKALGLFPVDTGDHGNQAYISWNNVGDYHLKSGGGCHSLVDALGPFTAALDADLNETVSEMIGFRICYYDPK